MILTLPWPPRDCSPNSRGHWAKTAKAKRAYRTACAWTAKSQGAGKLDAQALHIGLHFIPPSRRHMDLDNMLASAKAGLDGLADVLGVDDSKWTLTISRAPEGEIGGMVKVTVRAA